MTPATARATPLLLVSVLSACSMFGLTDEEQERLNFIKESATLFYDTERYGRALEFVDRGLEIAPKDYKLRSIQAWCYLQQVPERPEYLAVCEKLFDDLYELRSPSDHGEPVLLGLGTTQTRLAQRHLDSARVLEREIEEAKLPEHAVEMRRARVREHQDRARHHLERAERAFDQMLASEMNPREAHRNLLEIAWARDDYETAVEHGLRSLEYNLADQRNLSIRIDQTMDVGVEHELRLRLRRLVDDEIRTRSLMARMHSSNGDYAAALAHLDALLRIDPTRATDYYNRAWVHEQLGHVAEARKDYGKFLMFPNRDLSDAKVKRAFEFTKLQPVEADHGH
ncbi:MAG: tetratricopeptide repeat protein [Planctomycetes bacterium]|nr:tetratricopeptide repeat protein [Planctomycetota bacterium]